MVQAGQQQREFVAAQPCQHRFLAADLGAVGTLRRQQTPVHPFLQAARHLLQQPVAGIQAVGLVDRPEPGQVDQSHGGAQQWFLIQSVLQRLHEGLTVGQAGQGVVIHHPFELIARLPVFGQQRGEVGQLPQHLQLPGARRA